MYRLRYLAVSGGESGGSVGICGSFQGSERHTIYCERQSRASARWSWSLNSYAALGRRMSSSKKASQREEKEDDGLDVRTTPVRSSTRLNGSQGKLKAEKSGRSKYQVSNKQLDPTR